MATVQIGTDRADRKEQVTEATGGGAPTKDVELNVKTGLKRQHVIDALDRMKLVVIDSPNFSA